MSSPDLILLDAPPAEAKPASPASIHIKELNAIDQVLPPAPPHILPTS